MAPLLQNFLLVLLFILIGGVFSASEMALVSLRQTQIDEMARSGGRGQAVKRLTSDSNRFLSAVQVGVTIAGFFSASFGAAQIAPQISPIFVGWGLSKSAAATLSFILVTCFIAYLSIVFGELVPKRIAMQSAQTIALLVVRPLAVITAALRPVIWFLGVSTNVVLRILGRNPKEQRSAMGATELRAFVAAQETIREDERDMLVGMLSAGDRGIQEIMTPRTEVDFIESDLPIKDAQKLVSHMDHSRYPVRLGDSDDVVGFIHVRDLISPPPQIRVVGDLVRKITFFPTGKLILEALTELRANHEHLAVVVDEYGGIDGIVTLEDVVEEFIGEIRDEYDHERPVVIRRGGVEVVDGLANRAETLKLLGWEFPPGPFDTLAGFVVSELGAMPKVGDGLQWNGFDIRVASLDGRRIDRIEVRDENQVAGVEIGGGSGSGASDGSGSAAGDGSGSAAAPENPGK